MINNYFPNNNGLERHIILEIILSVIFIQNSHQNSIMRNVKRSCGNGGGVIISNATVPHHLISYL